jgi:hypothetical protein
MRVLVIGTAIALLTVPAYAQGMFGGGGGGGGGRRHHAQQAEGQPKRVKRNDEVITPVPKNSAPAGPFDPWQNMRGGSPDASTAKSDRKPI